MTVANPEIEVVCSSVNYQNALVVSTSCVVMKPLREDLEGMRIERYWIGRGWVWLLSPRDAEEADIECLAKLENLFQ